MAYSIPADTKHNIYVVFMLEGYVNWLYFYGPGRGRGTFTLVYWKCGHFHLYLITQLSKCPPESEGGGGGEFFNVKKFLCCIYIETQTYVIFMFDILCK